MANLQKIIKVTQAQYDTLASGGTVGDYTGLDDNYIYLVKDDSAPIIDITDGITAAHKAAVEANPAIMIQVDDYVYIPSYILDNASIPSYYVCIEADEYNVHWLSIDWNNLDIEASDSYDIRKTLSTSYNILVNLRNTNRLSPGLWYRLTDYQCTTTTSNTSSAGHSFDILIHADSTNTLNENCYAILHEGDTYFANCKLEAWRIWYCLDNDTNRFAWANTTNGKGVIYRMIDEFGNDVPYDFKNMLFTKSGSYTNAYTFSYTESSTIKDASLLQEQYCYGNIIKQSRDEDYNNQELNKIVFYTDASVLSSNGNIFGIECHSNTLSRNCFCNIFGNYCCNNTCNYNFFNNILGNSCDSNTFGFGCQSNCLGNDCTFNTFGNNCQGNILKDFCTYNNIKTNCKFNLLGSFNTYISFGVSCQHNIIQNNCSYIAFGTSSSSTISYCKHFTIDQNIQFLYINSDDTSASSSNYLQNVHIHLGVSGTSSSYLTVTIPDRNLAYETDVYMNGNELVYYENNNPSVKRFI